MSIELESKKRVDALITAANSKTGGNASDLTSAVQSLVNGYGGDGGATLLESGEITIVNPSNYYDIELTEIPDLFIFFTDSESVGAVSCTAGAICAYVPVILGLLPMDVANSGTVHSNLQVSIRGLNGNVVNSGEGTHFVYSNDSGHFARVARISSGYPFIAATYKWVAYKLWDGEST